MKAPKRSKPLETEARGRRWGKFNAKATVVDNVRFASRKESLYYLQLKGLLKAGVIRDLELQPRFPMPPESWGSATGPSLNRKPGCICTWVADFKYTNKEGKTVIVDVKGMRLPIYKLKRRLFDYFYPDAGEVIEA